MFICAGVYYQFMEDHCCLPVEDQYIHSVIHGDIDCTLILTFNYFLIQLIHDAISFEVNTIFRCTYGKLNEWEIVIWYTGTNRCMVIFHHNSSLSLTSFDASVVMIG